MKNLSKSRILPKYRYLQKQIDLINESINKLPGPQIDFSVLSPRERDLLEIFYGCAYKVQKEILVQSGYQSPKISFNEILKFPRFQELLSSYVNDKELELIANLLREGPKFISKNKIVMWYREERNELMSFFRNEQKLHRWLPQGELNEKSITWVSWDQILKVASLYGYQIDQDATNELISIQNWKRNDKNIICYRFLDMIGSEKIKDIFLKSNKLPIDYSLQRRVEVFSR